MRHEVASNLTKQAFANTLKEKMKEKSLSKITVTELIETCGLNRKTFYYHFKDMNSLIKWTVRNDFTIFLEKYDCETELKDMLFSILEYIQQNHYLWECISNSSNYYDFKKLILTQLMELMNTIINKLKENDIPKQYQKFLVIFYSEALAGILITYISNSTNYSLEVVKLRIDYLVDFLTKSIKSNLEPSKIHNVIDF